MTNVLEVAHLTSEYKMGVGGIKSVTMGLIPALASKDNINVSVITPFYDVYQKFYTDQHKEIKLIATVPHIYKGKEVKSNIFRVQTDTINAKPIYHYLIKPVPQSPVARIFEIHNEKNIYQAFRHSEPQNRIEYFNSAAAAMIRLPNDKIPEFDIIHGHTWHTGLAGCLAKEFTNLVPYQPIINAQTKPLKKIPHVISTVHMLLAGQNGTLTEPGYIKKYITSVGLPESFLTKFPAHSEDINSTYLKQLSIAMLYSDAVTTVSKGLAHEAVNGRGEDMDKVFVHLNNNQRLYGITNGINVQDWKHKFKTGQITAEKKQIKQQLATKYPNLDPNKKWFIFIGRFAKEKGVDYLPDLLRAVEKADGNLVILGSHVVTVTDKNGNKLSRYQAEIDELRSHKGVVIIDCADEQKKYGKDFRTAADCAVNLSDNEACGLVPMELMTCGAISVAPNIQGLPDTVIPLSQNSGTGILYDANPQHKAKNLEQAIISATEFLNSKEKDGTLDKFLVQLINNSQQYDWTANPANEYLKLYKKVLQREILTYDKPAKPILTAFKTPKKLNKIWQIGPNKSGSTTLFHFFLKNKIPSIHYGPQGKLATSIYENHLQGKTLIAPEYAKYTAFFDMENIYADPPIYAGQTLYKELDKQYPGSKFILNTRDEDNWIKSRLAHTDIMNGKSYAQVLCEKYKITEEELVKLWREEFTQHKQEVLEYFKDRPKDLLVFDIENDTPEKICEFFDEQLDLDPKLFGHSNKTPAPKPSLK